MLNAVKFGERFQMPIPSQAWKQEGVETLWQPLLQRDEEKVQTTNCWQQVVKTIVVMLRLCNAYDI